MTLSISNITSNKVSYKNLANIVKRKRKRIKGLPGIDITRKKRIFKKDSTWNL